MPQSTRASAELRWTDLEREAAAQAKRFESLRVTLADDPEAGAWARGEVAVPELSGEFYRRHRGLRSWRDDPCAWLEGQDRIRCRLAGRLGELHQQAARPLNPGHRSHLRNELFGPVAEDLDRLELSFRAWLLGEAPSWRDGAGEGRDLRRETDDFFRIYIERIDQAERGLIEMASELDGDLRELEQRREESEASLELVRRRLAQMQGLEQIETPFGRLPLGLNDMVLVFPVLLAAGFFACATLLVEAMRIRRVLVGLWRRRDRGSGVFSAPMVALVAPLWLDPLQPHRRILGRALLLAVPALVFAAAVGLLLFHRLLWGDFMAEARLNTWTYSLLYVGGAAMFFLGGARILSALRAPPEDPVP